MRAFSTCLPKRRSSYICHCAVALLSFQSFINVADFFALSSLYHSVLPLLLSPHLTMSITSCLRSLFSFLPSFHLDSYFAFHSFPLFLHRLISVYLISFLFILSIRPERERLSLATFLWTPPYPSLTMKRIILIFRLCQRFWIRTFQWNV